MNSSLNERDKKLLEIAVNKINDKIERLNKIKYVSDDKDKIRDIELKQAGLSIATNIISDMIWNSDEDFFKVDIEQYIKEFVEEMNFREQLVKFTYEYDKEENMYFIYHDYSDWKVNIEFQRILGILLRDRFYKKGIYNVCITCYFLSKCNECHHNNISYESKDKGICRVCRLLEK